MRKDQFLGGDGISHWEKKKGPCELVSNSDWLTRQRSLNLQIKTHCE